MINQARNTICRHWPSTAKFEIAVKDNLWFRWTREEEESVISMHMNNIKINDISEVTGRSVMSVSQKICRYYKKSREDLKNMMGGIMVIATKEEDGKYKDDERLRQLLYEFKYTKSELSRILGRTEGAIVCRITNRTIK